MVQQQQEQTLEEWVDAFELRPADIEFLTHMLLEKETPVSTEDVTTAILHRRSGEATMQMRQELRDASIYMPGASYVVGQDIVFPIFNYAQGRVVQTREGSNPDQGTFQVIRVDFEDGEPRDFASGVAEHVLNEYPDGKSGVDKTLVERMPEALVGELREHLNQHIESQLLASREFVRIAGYWFPRDLLFEVNEGHLNLAEAALDMASGGPMSTEEMLPELDFPTDINSKLQTFSLNYALQEDERFDEVGPDGRVLWFLRRLQPQEVLHPPLRLLYDPVAFSQDALTPELKILADEIDDEFGDPVETSEPDTQIQIVLPFHHRWSGTLPLLPRIAHLFPTATLSPRLQVVLVDGHSGERVQGWVVRPERFIWGLRSWYEKYDVPSGAYLNVACGEKPGEVMVTFQIRDQINEWVRTTTATKNQMQFAMKKYPVSIEYADEMIIAVEDVTEIDELQINMNEKGVSFDRIVLDIFRSLAKLTPQGTVHARTLFQSVNILRRVPPAPILALLGTCPYYHHVGDAYWRLTPGEFEDG